ncbi:MAG: insulinase family protein [Gammaproteobacteria bacterium]|nr:insulinase family protein [Gammaproteobacteria bacterium]
MSNSPFELVGAGRVASLGLDLQEYIHSPTGARHYHLDCADPNNAFMVAFPTLPEDSSGVAHILEHTTLCGSQRFPVRDPFFMMLRRSLNTYMNAFTSTDSTAYPFATQNRKDFDNLLEVYLDAVFFPRLDPLDFAQEGWRFELAPDADSARLEYHGVVYNEMKGAMSSPLAQLWQHVHGALFPDTVYRFNSGGDPAIIPELDHARLTAFHARHYHPSNAVFLTYGSFPVAEHQASIGARVLQRFDERRAPLVSLPQAPFEVPRAVETAYAAEPGDEPGTHIVWAWVHGDAADADDVIAMHLLASLLLEHGASPLRHFLETTDLAEAPSELCGVDDSARQLIFICGVEGSDRVHAEALERGILGVLERLAADGAPRETLEAAMDRLEMAQRDIGGDGYPFGLQLMGRLLPGALYRREPRALLDLDPVLERFRARLGERDFVRSLVRRVLLDNPHRVRVVMNPDGDKAARDAQAEAARLARAGAALDEGARSALEAASVALAERQAAPDDADCLPRVTLADIPAPTPLQRPARVVPGPAPIHVYECGTNGVFRVRCAYRLPALDAVERAVLPLWCEYVDELGCGAEDYLAVQDRRARIGSFSAYAIARPGPTCAEPAQAWLVISGKGLERRRDAIIDVVAEMVAGVRFDERERLLELLQQSRAEAEQSITDRGHQLAVLSAARDLTAQAALDEAWDGISAIRALKRYARQEGDRGDLETLVAAFCGIRSKLLGAPREVALIGEGRGLGGAEAACAALLEAPVTDAARFAVDAPRGGEPTAWLVNATVNFCAQAYPAVHESEPDAAVLAVLGRYLQDGFLHREIREKGGAYGSGAGYDADSQTFRLFSYRDPRVTATFDDFERALDWVSGDRDAQRLEEAILGTIRALDQPRSPAGEAERAFVSQLCGRTDAARRAFRERVLSVDHNALAGVAARYLGRAKGRRAALGGTAQEAAFRAAGLVPHRL